MQNCRMLRVAILFSLRRLVLPLMLWVGWGTFAWAAHGYALWGELKYPAGFSHFDYVNPNAPKQGELRLVSNLRVSTFDKYNPFTIKGTEPAYLSGLLFDTLLATSSDETASAYGLLARDVQVAADGKSVVFQMRPEARFHDGRPVRAEDVKHTLDVLLGPFAKPAYKSVLEDLAGVDVIDSLSVRFRFKKASRELPLTVGALPIFSRHWGMEKGLAKPFDQVVMDIPIGSGPYKIGPVKFGKDITYVRDPLYWGAKLNVRIGTANFDRITVKIYKDSTARLEALKAGEFDLMKFNSAGDWARRLYGPRFSSGELVKAQFKHQLPSGFQSFVLNTRRDKLKDVRVREALGLALDYEWLNRQLFYNSYERVNGLFGNTACQATGLPDEAQLRWLQPWRGQIPDTVFGPMAEPPRTDGSNSLRANLRKARALLADAGWTVQDGRLRNAQGQVFELEYLDSGEAMGRIITPWARNLEKLGIALKFRAVDFSLYQLRLQKFDFDITGIAYGGTHNPGQEYAEMFGSRAADTPDSGNYAGVRSAAIDKVIEGMTSAKTQQDLLPACRALDRLVAHGHYLIPEWSSSTHRIVYNARHLVPPLTMPAYSSGDGWAIETWWASHP